MHIASNLPIQSVHNALTGFIIVAEKCYVNKWIHFVELVIIQQAHVYHAIPVTL